QESQPRAFDPAVATAVADVSLESLHTYVYDLQNFSTRYAYSAPVVPAGQYIYDAFAANPNLQVAFQDFVYQGTPMRNVLAFLPGLDPSNRTVYAVGGHYDSVSSNSDPYVLAPGADDDGSGTAATMELARVLSRYRFNATIMFAAWDAEELGLVGSAYCTRCLAAQGWDFGLYLNLDMIAYDPTNASGIDIITDIPSQWAATQLTSLISDYGIGLVPTTYVSNVANSDHASFWAQGWDSIFLSESDFNFPNYHRLNDTVDKLNLNLLTNTTQASVTLLATLAGIAAPGYGQVFLDRAVYGTGSVAGVSLHDTDLNTNPLAVEVASVTVTSPQEPAGETVVLTETGPDTAVFNGSLPLGTAPGIPGELQVSGGATITASYAEASPPGTKSAAATVDGVPLTIRNVAVVPGIANATVVWETNKPADSLVSFGATPALGSLAGDRSVGTAHAVEVPGLVPDTPYYFDVASTDLAGQTVLEDRGGAHFAFRTLQGLLAYPPSNRVGYARSSDLNGNLFGANRIIVGRGVAGGGTTYLGAGQFDTASLPLPPSAAVTSTRIDLRGQEWVYTAAGSWTVRVLNGTVDPIWASINYTTLAAAPVDLTLAPTFVNADLAPGRWNTLAIPAASFDAVKYRVNTGALSFRIDGPTAPPVSIFGWATGFPQGCPDEPDTRPRLSVTYSPTADTQGPFALNLQAAPNPTFAATVAAVTATIDDTTQGGTPIANAEFFLGPDPGVGMGSPMSAADGAFDTATEDAVYLLDVSGLGFGVYQGFARGRDLAGNWGPASTFFLFVGAWDLAPPSATVSDAPDPAPLGGTVTITANVTDDVQVAEVWLNVTRPDSSTAFNVTMPKPGADWVHATTYGMVGTWAYVVWASDTSGKWAWGQGTFRIDDVLPPTITAVAANPDPGEYPAAVNLTATIADDSGVAGAIVNVSGPGGAWLLNFTMARNGSAFSMEYTYGLLGNYTFVIWAMDIYGNWANATGSFSVLDATPPLILNDTAVPDPAEIYTVVNVSAEISDLLLNNLTLTVTEPAGAPFTVLLGWDSVTGRFYYPMLADTLGLHTYQFQARDSSGNTATAAGTFLVQDTTSPLVAAAADPANQANGAVVRVLAQAQDNYQLAGLAVTIWDPANATVGTFPMGWDAPNATYRYDFTLAALGTYSFTVTATDVSGNAANASGTFVSFDGVAPWLGDLTIDPPLAELGLGTLIGVEAFDNIGVAEVRFEVRDAASTLVGNLTAVYNATSGLWELRRVYAEGQYSFVIWVRDLAGNLVYAPPATFVVAAGGPPTADAGPDLSGDTTASLALDGGNSTDDVGIVRWEWTVSGPGGTWTYTTTIVDFLPPSAGVYVATLRVWDAADRTDTDSAQLTIVEPPTGGGPGPTDWWWLILVLLVVGIVGLIVILAAAKRRKPKEEAPREPTRPPPQEFPPPPEEFPPPPDEFPPPPP
ncbi:MAG TPA: M20/M25/M40 family metallo-hydrolase, partial [Thermoplasmata archaeon]|nr:M20/M25/M40 family metallo-hydrolase [Thermoplasmata archaeon]